jgi:hypothetical protein
MMKHGRACKVEETAKRGVSSIALAFVVSGIPNPIITTIFDTHTAIGCPHCDITCILGTAVT